MPNKDKIIKLNEKLLKWAKEYFQDDAPSVSDAQYDGSYNELKVLVKENPEYSKYATILSQVGSLVDERFKKVKHKSKMFSLSNAFNADDIFHFDKQIKDLLHTNDELKYAAELKIDGLSIAIHYKDGKLIQALTRGDGQTGEDVTHNVLTINDVPKTIDFKGELEVRGEVFMSYKVFEQLNAKGNAFANPRNAAAGTIRQLDSNIAKERKLSTFIYWISNPLEIGLHSHDKAIDFLKTQGFNVNKETIFSNIKGVVKFIKEIENQSFNYATDGVVVKVNDYDLYEEIGYTSKFPKYMIAYKFPEEVAETKLIDIFVTIGRTGRVTYNAKLESVQLAGTSVSAATLHNADYIREIDINVGDIVKVKKAGEIIPKVLGVAKKINNNKWIEAKKCPICSSKLERHVGEVDQYCVNTSCPGRHQAALEHFVSRGAMNIEGVSNEILRKFILKGFVTDVASLYKLEEYKDQILKLEGFKEKSVNNILESIEKSKNQDLDKLIFGIGIRHVGAKNASILARRFGSMKAIMEASKEEIKDIRDLGPKVAESIYNFFRDQKNVNLINSLLENGVKPKELPQAKTDLFKGMTFVITGTLSKPRSDFKRIIEENGGNVSNSISKNTSFLLAGEKAGSKKTKAEELNIKILSEDEFNKRLI